MLLKFYVVFSYYSFKELFMNSYTVADFLRYVCASNFSGFITENIYIYVKKIQIASSQTGTFSQIRH